MARKSRLNPGGFASGGVPPNAQGGWNHRDAPLNHRGTTIWIAVIGLLVVVGIALFAYGFATD